MGKPLAIDLRERVIAAIQAWACVLRAVGSSVRMFSIATEADVDDLFAEWEDSLSTSAYPVTGGQSELLEHSIEFSGPGIANAKIIVAPKVDGGPRIIEFDATLD